MRYRRQTWTGLWLAIAFCILMAFVLRFYMR
jgi:F0F1-type ATP synthase membrane subunit b/b'